MREFGVQSSTQYIVETNFPNADDTPEKRNTFAPYSPHAFTNVNDPGEKMDKLLINTHSELFSKMTSKAIMSFDTFEDAKAVAFLIASVGRLAVGWRGDIQDHIRKKYRLPISVRIVEEHRFCARRLMDFEYVPADPYETELEALKKKYGKIG